MVQLLTGILPALGAVMLVRLMLRPLKSAVKLAARWIVGFVCLWLLNTLMPFTGVMLPINAITVLLAGTLGLPGIAMVTILAVLP